jgi:hypothetical protein
MYYPTFKIHFRPDTGPTPYLFRYPKKIYIHIRNRINIRFVRIKRYK